MGELLILVVLISLVFLVVIIIGLIVKLSTKDTCFHEIPSGTWFDFAVAILKKTYIISIFALFLYVIVTLNISTFSGLLEHIKANILGLVSLAATLLFSSILSLFEFAVCLGIIESFTGSPTKEKGDSKIKSTRVGDSKTVAKENEIAMKPAVVATHGRMSEIQNKDLISSEAGRPKVKEQCLDLNKVDRMSALQFEEFCVVLLKHNGFTNVRTTPTTGDQGVDIIATKNGIRHAIQCKHYKGNVGNSAVQEVHTGKTFYHCSVGVVMTNSFFTSSAQELAKASQTILWDRLKLKKLMENAEKS